MFTTKKTKNFWKRCLNLFLTLPIIKGKSDLNICSNFVAFSGQNISLMEKQFSVFENGVKMKIIILSHHWLFFVIVSSFQFIGQNTFEAWFWNQRINRWCCILGWLNFFGKFEFIPHSLHRKSCQRSSGPGFDVPTQLCPGQNC